MRVQVFHQFVLLQTRLVNNDSELLGGDSFHLDGIPEPALPFNSRKLILRRAAQFLTYGDTISIGYGIKS
jgi:acyl CoA:acetate/3-ketoacid CoA transferase